MNDQSLFKGMVGGACAVFTLGRSALRQEIENCLWAGGGDETSGRRCSRRARSNNPTTRTHYTSSAPLLSHSAVASSFIRCAEQDEPSFAVAASELHGRDTHDERRRAGGSLLSAAEGESARWIPSGGVGVVRLGLQDHRGGQGCTKRLHSGKPARTQTDFPHQSDVFH